MARPARVVIPDVAHHVMQGGNRRQPVFFGEHDYSAYLAPCADRDVCPREGELHVAYASREHSTSPPSVIGSYA